LCPAASRTGQGPSSWSRRRLYAIPALLGATITVVTERLHVYGIPAALGAAAACFGLRMLGVHLNLNAPAPPGRTHE
jgi:uncharacterized membrane protein YeiH